MPSTRKYTNVKVGIGFGGLATGPQTLAASSTYTSSAIPCKGASHVVLTLKSTDATAPVSWNAFLTNDVGITGQLNGSSLGYTVTGSAGACNIVGGAKLIIYASGPKRMWHDFVVLNLVSNAGTPQPGFTMDAEVYYDNSDAGAMQREVGQDLVAP